MEYFEKARQSVDSALSSARSAFACGVMNPHNKKMLADQKLECGTDYEYGVWSKIIKFHKPITIYGSDKSHIIDFGQRRTTGYVVVRKFHTIEYQTSEISFVYPAESVGAYNAVVTNIEPPIDSEEIHKYPSAFPRPGTTIDMAYVRGGSDMFKKDRFKDIGPTVTEVHYDHDDDGFF